MGFGASPRFVVSLVSGCPPQLLSFLELGESLRRDDFEGVGGFLGVAIDARFCF